MSARGPALALPIAATRRTVKFRLLGTIKGKKYQVIVSGPNRVILYGGRVFARPLGPSDAAWAWYPLPIEPTANEFTVFKLPIDPTAETYTEFKLPIDPTAETYSEVPLPLHPTPAVSDWVDIPVSK